MTRAEEEFDKFLGKVRRYPSRVEASGNHETIVAKWFSVVDHVSYIEYQFTRFGNYVSVKVGNLNPPTTVAVRDLEVMIDLYKEIL